MAAAADNGGVARSPDRRFVLGVDLDGVCADFYDGLRPIVEEWLGLAPGSLPTDVSYGLREWNLDPTGGYEELHRFAVTQRALFRNLAPIPGAPAALRRLSAREDVRIRIITHRLFIKHFHEEAIQQTVAWLDNHGIPYWDICFMKDKAAVGADLYIEDSPGNVKALRDAKHRTIVFTNSTNTHLRGLGADTWGQIERIVENELKRWLKKARAKSKLPGR